MTSFRLFVLPLPMSMVNSTTFEGETDSLEVHLSDSSCAFPPLLHFVSHARESHMLTRVHNQTVMRLHRGPDPTSTASPRWRSFLLGRICLDTFSPANSNPTSRARPTNARPRILKAPRTTSTTKTTRGHLQPGQMRSTRARIKRMAKLKMARLKKEREGAMIRR